MMAENQIPTSNGVENDGTQMSIDEQERDCRFESPNPQGFDSVFPHGMGVAQRNSKSDVDKSLKSSYKKCKRCNKMEANTIHIGCNHVFCCVDCGRKCRECLVQGCGEKHPNHLRFYPDTLNSNSSDTAETSNYPLTQELNDNATKKDNTETFAEVENFERGNKILQEKRHDFGTCPICRVKANNWILVSCITDDIDGGCGHCVCDDCYKILKKKKEKACCPVCRQTIIMYLAV